MPISEVDHSAQKDISILGEEKGGLFDQSKVIKLSVKMKFV